jgi:hypothetical protein
VDVVVPGSGLVAIRAQADIASSVDQSCAFVELAVDGVGHGTILGHRAVARRKWSAPGTDECGGGTIDAMDAGWIIFETTPGLRNFSLRYHVAVGTTGTYANRRLWVKAVE